MKVIEAYKADSGKIFETEQDCLLDDHEFYTKQALREFTNKMEYALSEDFMEEEVMLYLYENRYKLIEIFNTFGGFSNGKV